jgi:hypothetical protein
MEFEEARQVFLDATGFMTRSKGFVGPDRYIVVPLSPPWEVVYNDTVQTVTFDGAVEAIHYDRVTMGSWPTVGA